MAKTITCDYCKAVIGDRPAYLRVAHRDITNPPSGGNMTLVEFCNFLCATKYMDAKWLERSE